jgi:short-subunit dehydrogenase
MKHVLITGAYGGLGEAMAMKFSKEGFGLVLLGRDTAKLKTLEAQLTAQTSVLSIHCDVSNWESCVKAHGLIKASNISIDVLINNAGITYIQSFDKDYEIEKYQNLINTNLNGSVYMTKLFLSDIIQNQGSIINISSVIGYAPVIGRTAYAASKFGMEGFFSVLAAEQENKTHIMMVYPTFIATQIREKTEGKHEINEILSAEEVANWIFRDYQKKMKKVYYGKTAKLSKLMYHFFPKMYVNLMRQKVMKSDQVN